MDFEVENREKSMQKRFKKNELFFTSIFRRFWLRFKGSWGGFGEVLGNILTSKTCPQRAKLIFSIKLRFSRGLGRVWGGSWEGLGRVLGGFGEGLGRVLGAFWTL